MAMMESVRETPDGLQPARRKHSVLFAHINKLHARFA